MLAERIIEAEAAGERDVDQFPLRMRVERWKFSVSAFDVLGDMLSDEYDYRNIIGAFNMWIHVFRVK